MKSNNLSKCVRMPFLMLALIITYSLSLSGGGWIYKANMPTARTYLGACVLNGKIYVLGGATGSSTSTSAVEMYDPSTDTWVQKASMPSALCYPNVCVLNGKIYVFGGSTTMWSGVRKDVFVYDPDADTWMQKDTSQYEYLDPIVAVVDSQVFLIGGGKDAYTAPVHDANAYIPSTDTWIKKADMPTARYMFTACVLDKKIYCIGGSTQNWMSVFYSKVEVYDPATDTWATRTDMPVGRWCPSACQVDSLIYVIGGFSGQNACDRVDIFNPNSNAWTTGTPIQHFRHGLATCAIDGKIYVIGGSYLAAGAPTFLNLLEVFDTRATTGIQYARTNDNEPINFHLSQNYPNPFNPTTTINYIVGKASHVKLIVNNVLGQKVATLIDSHMSAGFHSVVFDAKNLSSGIFFYSIEAENFRLQNKMLLLR